MLRVWSASFVVGFIAISVGATTWRVVRAVCCGCYSDSKADVARAAVNEYAHHLSDWVDHHDDRDPWGNRYVIELRGRHFVVASAGEDGKLGTADDITADVSP